MIYNLSTFFAFVSFLAGAQATDVFYFDNCNGNTMSQISYFSDQLNSFGGQPTFNALFDGTIQWEGTTTSASIADANGKYGDFTGHVDPDAYGMPVNTLIGSALWNFGGGCTFDYHCWRDTGRLLYTDATYGDCYALYYCESYVAKC